MELVEIKGLFKMDSGAPSPIIISNDNELYIAFHEDEDSVFLSHHQDGINHETKILGIKFKLYLKYVFGLPGNETIFSHPYSKFGMKSYSFYELKQSDLINSLQNIEKNHPYYNPEMWKMYKHYILTFHDNMFECIAQSFEIKEKNNSFYNQANAMLNELLK